MSDEPEAPPAAETPPPAPKKSRGPLIAIVVLLLAGGAAGGWWFLRDAPAPEAGTETEGAPAAAVPTQAEYMALQPAFIVNLADEEASRYLQVDIEVMARSSGALDEVERHLPRIRNSLLLLLGSRRVADLADRAGKEQLQADVATEIQRVLVQETGQKQIEAVYFTSFVMQ